MNICKIIDTVIFVTGGISENFLNFTFNIVKSLDREVILQIYSFAIAKLFFVLRKKVFFYT